LTRHLVNVEQVGALRTLRVVKLQPGAHGICLAALHLAPNGGGIVQQIDSAAIVRITFAHFACSVKQRHNARALFDDQRLDDACTPKQSKSDGAKDSSATRLLGEPHCVRLDTNLRFSENAFFLRVLVVETSRDVARELQVLSLILAHRHEARL